MVYLAYIQNPNTADKVKIMFEIWKSRQKFECSTAITRQKKQIWLEMYTFLSKNICRSAKQLVEGCAEMSLFLILAL